VKGYASNLILGPLLCNPMVEVETSVSHDGAGAPTRWLHGRTWLRTQSSPEKLELALQGSIFDAIFSDGAVAVWGAHLGGFHRRWWRRKSRTTAGPRAQPSAVPRACSNGRAEPGPAQTAAVIAYLCRLGAVGAQGAL
jgi:hypothetical protein